MNYELPNNLIYRFNGSITIDGNDEASVDVKNILLRGMVLRNTTHVYGLVIFTGHDTKLAMNSRAAPSKRSNVEEYVNLALIFIFISLAVLCVVSTISHVSWVRDNSKDSWYLDFLRDEEGFAANLSFITFLILFNNLTPISLYISMEVVRLYQARLIEYDKEMYYEKSDTPALARTSNLNEELGQIQYIFSDKTGTLTCNEMEFRRASIYGRLYYYKEIPKSKANKPQGLQSGLSMVSMDSTAFNEVTNGTVGSDSVDDIDISEATKVPETHFDDFMTVLAVCHTALPEKLTEEDKKALHLADSAQDVVYQSQSPDEIALVQAAKELFFELTERTQTTVTVSIRGKPESFQILNVNEFNSDRKRMSVVVRRDDGRVQLFCKGADSVMFERLAADQAHIEKTMEHIDLFAVDGLRTLVIAKRDLAPKVYEEWNEKYTKASLALRDRAELLDKVANEIEKDMDLLGSTAIEDKLQDGVPETIHTLSSAGIKIWVLTGDKQETAVNIAYSTRLFEPNMHIVFINCSEEDDVSTILKQRQLEVEYILNHEEKPLALVVDGNSLNAVLNDEDNKLSFLLIARLCIAVVACRVSPKQKAEMVTLVKEYVKPQPITLAIGDGANDVSMIQEAHVGIGISGHEGMQAVQSSDYAIAQFRFLERLLLVHGHWNYMRLCKLILYSFYKNMAFVLTLFYYTFSNAFSGTTLYESWLGAGWNVGWTLLPVMFVSVLDQDASALNLKQFPSLYGWGQARMGFNLSVMFRWSMNAVVHSLIIYYCGVSIFGGIISSTGLSDDLFLMGTMINGCLMLTVNFKIGFETFYWTTPYVLILAASTLLWFLYIIVYSYMYAVSADFYYVGVEVYKRGIFWVALPFIPGACMIVDICSRSIRKLYRPSPIDIVQEIQAGYGVEVSGLSPQVTQVKEMSEQKPPNGLPKLAFIPNQQPDKYATSPKTKKVLVGEQVQTQAQTSKNPIISSLTQLDKYTLEFANDPRLEKRFASYFYFISAKQTRLAFSTMLILYIMYFAVNFGALSWVMSTTIIILGGIYISFTFSPYFEHFYQVTILVPLFAGSIVKTLSIEDNGILSAVFFPILAFTVLRLRFKYAFPISAFDMCFYLTYVLTKFGFGVFAPNAVLVLAVFSLGAVGAYNNEIAIRNDFLLQKDLNKERHQSQTILENMLPPHVTKKMKEGSKVIAEAEEEVTILFCDIQDFSNLVLKHKPEDFVTLLDGIYSRFEKLSAKHSVQKMETVGPTYMACAGLQGTNKNHALAAAALAEDMMDEITRFKTKEGEPIRIRIGINTGRVISGVVGEKKPQYCLFGDTVNTASRMQSTGIISRIQVSSATWQYLQGQYEAETRVVKAKGKGELTTYVLVKRRAAGGSSVPNSVGNGPGLSRSNSKSSLKSTVISGSKVFAPKKTKQIREDIPMHPISMKFLGAEETEASYAEEVRPLVATQIRACAFIFVIGYAGSCLFEVFDGASSKSLAIGVGLRFMFVVLGSIFIRFTRSSIFQNNPQRFGGAFYFFEGFLLSIVSVGKQERLGLYTALSVIMSIYLIFNAGGLPFLSALSVCSGIAFSFVLLGAILNAAIEEDTDTSSSQDIGYQILVIYVILALVIDALTTRLKEYYMRRNFVLTSTLKEETKKSDDLISNMLPQSVIVQLKAGRHTIASFHEDVAILFSDIVGFTDKASRTAPDKVVEMLSQMFRRFDALTEAHGVYKVQTIGDAYVVVAGVPTTNNSTLQIDGKNSAERMAAFALDMVRVLRDVEGSDGQPVKIRIGIHFGKLVAGVIGKKVYRYDIWGGDVLIAASMESKGAPERIHVSEPMKKRLEGVYSFEERGEMEVSGTKMPTYFLVDPNAAAE
eukprot:TRINITY_DN698_c0_g1_i11.p1 TRINITY_DN698_c0_g1~~TRINITY_DN698_c0_g1_i11.p1  ORF type:complete len:1852 (+),score=333.99 TRINITY_DN698_c0_g1_i11:998-6553(+)